MNHPLCSTDALKAQMKYHTERGEKKDTHTHNPDTEDTLVKSIRCTMERLSAEQRCNRIGEKKTYARQCFSLVSILLLCYVEVILLLLS